MAQRVADYALFFSRDRLTQHRVVGLLSAAFSEKSGSFEAKVPICAWDEAGDLLSETSPAAPLSKLAR